MSEKNPLFRKAALDKLSSPERLDVLMQVTSPKGWLALATVGAILAAIIVWSVVGTIQERLDGQGMIISGLREIKATGAGVIDEFTLTQGGLVKVGDRIATLKREDVEANVSASDTNAAQIAQAANVTVATNNATIEGYRNQIRTTQDEITRTRAQLAKAEEEVALRTASFKAGLSTRIQVTQTEQQAESIRAKIPSLEGQIQGLSAQIAALQQQSNAARNQAAAAGVTRKTTQRVAQSQLQLTAEVSGKIIELRVTKGEAVQVGQTIAVIEPSDSRIQTVVYFDSRTARQIRPGMEAQISPTEIKREEFGYIKGKVIEVGAAPVTVQKMQADLANGSLAQELYGKVAPIEIRAELLTKKTPSGFEWSTSEGPPFAIAANSRINVAVVVDRKKPYTLVLPMIKSAIGAS